MKVKLFGSDNAWGKKGRNLVDLESEINSWLEKKPAMSVMGIEQSAHWGSMDRSKLLISVWYEESL